MVEGREPGRLVVGSKAVVEGTGGTGCTHMVGKDGTLHLEFALL